MGITFGIANADAARAKALTQAVADGRRQAEDAAKAAGLELIGNGPRRLEGATEGKIWEVQLLYRRIVYTVAFPLYTSYEGDYLECRFILAGYY